MSVYLFVWPNEPTITIYCYILATIEIELLPRTKGSLDMINTKIQCAKGAAALHASCNWKYIFSGGIHKKKTFSKCEGILIQSIVLSLFKAAMGPSINYLSIFLGFFTPPSPASASISIATPPPPSAFVSIFKLLPPPFRYPSRIKVQGPWHKNQFSDY